MTSDIYVHETGPKLTEKIIETRKIMATPARDRLSMFPSGFCDTRIASIIKHKLIPIVPNNNGLRRPTRSMRNIMKNASTQR